MLAASLTKHNTTKTHGGYEAQRHIFVAKASGQPQVSAFLAPARGCQVTPEQNGCVLGRSACCGGVQCHLILPGIEPRSLVNPLTRNDPYRGRTAPLTSKVPFYIFFQQIQVLNILNMVYTLFFFPLQNAVCFIIETHLVPVLFTFCIQGVLK